MEQRYSSPQQSQLYELLAMLHQLGRDMPQLLISLTELVQPEINADRIVSLLGKMFDEAPALVMQNPNQVYKLIHESAQENNIYKLLGDFRELQLLFHQISYLQLLHLSNNLLPPGLSNGNGKLVQLDFLTKCQEIFQTWSREVLLEHHKVLQDTPLHMERHALLLREPQIPWEIIHLVIELLKLPLEELQNFQEWFRILPKKQLLYLVQLLQIEPAVLLELKRRFDGTFQTFNPQPNQMDTGDQMNIEMTVSLEYFDFSTYLEPNE